jgi:hypothetical protein
MCVCGCLKDFQCVSHSHIFLPCGKHLMAVKGVCCVVCVNTLEDIHSFFCFSPTHLRLSKQKNIAKNWGLALIFFRYSRTEHGYAMDDAVYSLRGTVGSAPSGVTPPRKAPEAQDHADRTAIRHR